MTDTSVEPVKVSIATTAPRGRPTNSRRPSPRGREGRRPSDDQEGARAGPEEAIATNEDREQHRLQTQDVPRATADDVVDADAVIFGSPTRYGNVAAQLKQFIDTLGPQWSQNLLADKVYSAFTSTSTEHGGQETTILGLYNTIQHFGGIVVAPGYTDPVKFADGNPYGTSFVSGQGTDLANTALNAARF